MKIPANNQVLFASGYRLITAQPPSRHSPFQDRDPSIHQICHPIRGNGLCQSISRMLISTFPCRELCADTRGSVNRRVYHFTCLPFGMATSLGCLPFGMATSLGDPKLYGNSGAKGQDTSPSHSVVGQGGLVPGGGALVRLGSGHPLSTPSGGLVGVPRLYSGVFDWVCGSRSWDSTQTPHATDGVHSLASALSTGLGQRPSANATSMC